MKRLCICSSGGTGLALLVSLAMGSWAYGQCNNDAGAGDKPEGEACLVDLDSDTTNGGCNSSPAVFVTLDTADFTNGVVDICGVASNYNGIAACDVDGDCPAGDTCVGDPNPGDGTAEGECQGPGQPSANFRDTDWYLVTQAAMTANDTDGNGVVQINSTFLGSELDLVTFLIAIEDPGGACTSDVLDSVGCIAVGSGACDVDADCPSGDCVGDPNPGDGNADGACASANNTATETLIIADHPDGVVVFASPGQCDGSGIYDGFECATGNNDYILEVWFSEAPEACQPGPPQGPCNEAASFGVVGCEDPACCAQVCLTPGLQFCCATVWNLACASAAIDLGCAPEPGGPVNMATGDDNTVEGYLRVKSDPYGSYADSGFGGTPNGGDEFNPTGWDPAQATFSCAYYVFIADANQRELLSNNVDWQENYDFGADDSLDREITQINIETDTDLDGVTDQLNSAFHVTGAGVDLSFTLQQNVANHGPGVATMTQELVITNNLASPIEFELLRVLDGDLTWVGTPSDDSVGTGTNNAAAADLHVYIQEAGDENTCITMSSPDASNYAGGKLTVNPDPDDPNCPEYGYGSDTDQWDAYGLPACWHNNIANVGYNTDGASGATPGDDAHTDLKMIVSLPASGEQTIVVTHTYGQPCPYGQDCAAGGCIWDCQSVPNGIVDVADFLAILAQFGQVGTSCDFDGGGVGVTDFLEFLANFGPCP
jgi:hypothetical protein